ncbi:MAG: tRNA uridine-5-carboxymethylaminomethyl(34) synthesis GTPase MnmE [Puniceicoccaceae bacterium]
MYSNADTIVALATPMARAALGTIRMSGPLALTIAIQALGKDLPTRRAEHREWQGGDGKVLDDGVAILYRSPKSYTGEDLLEFTAHGNPLILESLVNDCLARGCRLAEPGEFTKRAFLNEKLSIVAAEGIGDLIAAQSEAALAAARRQLAGGMGQEIDAIIDRLLRIIAHLEAYIDFPEEDLPPEDRAGPRQELQDLCQNVQRMIDTNKYRELLSEGVQVVIVGPPNAGKSSLLNCLYGAERVIVSDQPGTTRDAVGEFIMIGPYRIQIMDTAGIRGKAKALEARGIGMTLSQLIGADIVLLVVDHRQPFPLPAALEILLEDPRTILIHNKIDLPATSPQEPLTLQIPQLKISIHSRQGIDDLRSTIEHHITHQILGNASDRVLYNQRHCRFLREALHHLNSALSQLRHAPEPELIVSDLWLGLDALSCIVGAIDNEAMLDALFETFCIGK